MWGFLSVIVMVVGLLMYGYAWNPAHPKREEVGRIMFFVGLLVFLLQNGTHIVTLAGH